jgi:hypothetical protein
MDRPSRTKSHPARSFSSSQPGGPPCWASPLAFGLTGCIAHIFTTEGQTQSWARQPNFDRQPTTSTSLGTMKLTTKLFYTQSWAVSSHIRQVIQRSALTVICCRLADKTGLSALRCRAATDINGIVGLSLSASSL